jgi:hypothetical protein
MQEFLYLGPDSSGQSKNTPGATTPEPGTFLLFGTGIVALLRKKIFN